MQTRLLPSRKLAVTAAPFPISGLSRLWWLAILLLFPLTLRAQEYSYQYQFGGETQGTPQFNQPIGVAVDGSGNVYVADKENHRIVKLNPNGTIALRFGTLGRGDGQFNQPQGVAVDGSGNVYVLDQGNYRIQKFSSSGTFLAKFGSYGSGDGQFILPTGVAVDGSGNIYVADAREFRTIQKFSSSGSFLAKFGSYGFNDGQFQDTFGVAVDGSGNVYVADMFNHRIQKFNAKGTFLVKFGTPGSGDGQLVQPQGVAVDRSGNVYVADKVNNRIQKFSSSGTFLAKFGTRGSGDGQLIQPQGVAVDGSGNVYVADIYNNRIQKFSSSGSFLAKFGTPGTSDQQLLNPYGVAVNLLGQIYVADQANNRIQQFNSNGFFLAKFGTPGSGDRQFIQPQGVAVDGSGNVYVADTYNNRIQKFSYSGAFLAKFGTPGNRDGQFNNPTGVAVDGSGNVYVVDAGNIRIQQFNAKGTFLAKFGTLGTGNGQFRSPQGIAVDGSGKVYVADAGNNRIQQFSSSGAFLAKFGTPGSGDGQFNYPQGVAVDRSGNVYVADAGNNRIQKFSSSGAFLAKFGTRGSGDGQFIRPTGVAVDGSGKVYVADAGNNRIQRFIPTFPEIALSVNGTNLADGSGSVNFGSTPIGTPLAKTFTIANTGPASLTLSNLALPAGFALVGSFPATVASNASATFTVRLAAASAGNYAGGMSFANNDADENPFNISLSGTVTVPAPKVASFSPTQALRGQTVSIAGAYFTGATAVKFNGVPATFTLKNDGQITATVPIAATTGPLSVTTAKGTGSSSASLVINKSNQTISFPTVPAPTYGQAPITLSATATSGLPVSFSLVSGPAQLTGSQLTFTGAGDVTIKASQIGNAFYNAAGALSQVIRVQKAVLTVKAPPATRLYGQANPPFTLAYSGFVNGDDAADLDTSPTASTAATPASHVGSYGMSPSGGSDNNYAFSFQNGTLTINQATLTATADTQSRAYGGANPALTISYSGFVNGEHSTDLDTPPTASTPAEPNSPAGDYPITLTGGVDADYLFTLVNGTFSVGKTPLTVTAVAQTKTYGELNPALTLAYSGFVNGEDSTDLDTPPTVSTTATPGSDAGNYPITVSGGVDGKYSFVYENALLQVNKASLTATADNQNKTYGEANPVLTFTYSGFVNGDDATDLDTPPTISTTATTASHVGNYPISLIDGEDHNYAFSLVNGSLAVEKATLTATADNQSRVYGGANPALTISYSGFVNGEDSTYLDTPATASTPAEPNSPAGDYPITLTGGVDADYLFTLVNGTLSVGETPLTGTIANQSKTDGQGNPASARRAMAEATNTLQAAPNPFSHRVTVNFQTPEAGRASLALFDLQGIRLQGLFEKEVQGGESHRVVMDGHLLPNGLYLLRLINGQEVRYLKVMVAK